MQERSLRMGIIGPGRLGSSLAAALAHAGHEVAAVGARQAGPGSAPSGWPDAAKAAGDSPQGVAEVAELVFLCVPDSQVRLVADSISWRPDHRVVHCSGALGLDQLAAASAAGAAAGCFHPLQTFPSRMPEPSRFEGISCGIDGTEGLGELLSSIAKSLGARPFSLRGVDRALYHAAAVASSNLVVALAVFAGRLWEMAGLPPGSAREALAPLTRATAENIAHLELVQALTGPVARGDVATVERHLEALRADGELRELYRRLSWELLRLPLGLPEEANARLQALLGAD